MSKAELAKAFVQIVPTTDGIKNAIGDALSGESTKAGKTAGGNIAQSIAGAVGGGLAALGIAGVVASSITAGSEYETAIAKLGTIADTSAMPLSDLKQTIADMSDQMGISQSDLAEAAYSTISATGDTAGALGIVGQAAQLATAGFTDTDSAISVLTTAMNAYGLSADNVSHISDSLITTQNLGVTTVADLASNMGKAIATASGYGVSLENLEAGYIATTKSGISTAESTTYMASMMAELGKNGSTVSETLKEKTGKSFAQLMNGGASLSDVLGILTESVHGDSEAFMNLWGSQEAGKAANAIVNQGLDTFNENLKTLQTQAGTTETAYGQMTDTFAWKMQNIQTKGQNLSIKLFEAIYPVLDELIEKAMSFVDNMNVDDVMTKLQSFMSGAVPLITTLGNAVMIVGQHLDVIVPILTAMMAFNLVSKIMGVISSVASLAAGIQALAPVVTLLTGPFGIIVAVIAGVVTGLITLYKTNEKFRDAVNKAWESIKTFIVATCKVIVSVVKTIWSGLLSFLKGVMTAIRTIISGTWNVIKTITSTIWNGLLSFLKGVMTTIRTIISGTWNAIRNTVTTVWNGIKTFITNVLNGIKATVSNIWTAYYNLECRIWKKMADMRKLSLMLTKEIILAVGKILLIPWKFIWVNFGNYLTSAWKSIEKKISDALNTIKTGITRAWNEVKTLLMPIVNAIKTGVTTAWNGIKTITTTVMNAVKAKALSVWNALKSQLTTIVNAIKSVITRAWNGIKTQLTTISNAVKSVVTKAWNGIKTVTTTVMNAVKTKALSVWNALKIQLTTIANAIKTAITKAWNSVKSTTSSVMNSIKSAITTVWNGIKTKVTSVMTGIKTTVTSIWNSVKTTVKSAINGIKTTISSGLNSAKSTVSSIFKSIKSSISTAINGAKDVVSKGINAIKKKFDFTWSLPKLKLPHFAISGKFSLDPPSVPSFDVDWYDRGGIFRSPTVIGVGEKRPEFVGALDDLRGIVRQEAGGGGNNLIPYMLQIIRYMERYFPEFARSRQLTLNGAFVGEVAPVMDAEFGKRAMHRERRN